MVTLTSPWAPHVYVTSLSLPKTRPSLHFTCSLSIDLRFSLVTEDSVLRPEKEPISWLGEEFCIWNTQWKSIFCVMRLRPSDVWGKRSRNAAGSQISAVQENNNGLFRESQNLLTTSMTFLPGNIVKLVLCTNEKQFVDWSKQMTLSFLFSFLASVLFSRTVEGQERFYALFSVKCACSHLRSRHNMWPEAWHSVYLYLSIYWQ